jgi:phosphoglycerate dehydrogenase-like enzyme
MVAVAVIDDYQQAAQAYGTWSQLPPDVEVSYFGDHLVDLDAQVARLAPFEVIVATRERTRFGRDLLSRLPNLRLLISTGMGTAHIDVPATHELGITVSGTTGSGGGPVELTWALILELTRSVAAEDAAVRAGAWGQSVPLDLNGATLGLAGLGRLGSRVGAIGLGFGMRVIAWSQNLDADTARAQGVEPVDKATLMAESDVLSVHLQLSDRSRGTFGAADLALMKPTALLINTARGPIVDEPALVAALQERRIGGAGLDVFDTEPLPGDHHLRSTPNTVLSPHIGYVSQRGYTLFYSQAADDVAAWLAGAPLRVLNP